MANHLDRIGQQVGEYRLLRWLGGGGFGDVYLAEHVRDHSQVAIKLLHIQLSHNEDLKAFINEARTIRLKHAHIVPLLDFAISREDIPFLVMEYVAQGTLRDHHPKGSRVPLPLVVNYAQQVASALQYAHEQRLIHRDVKPENMLLRADGTVLLSDFGLVAVTHSLPSLNLHQRMGGTVPYMAPEQTQGKARAASDQYSLGVVVYEWIAGRRPFEGTATEIAMQHVLRPPPSLVAQVPTLSSAVEAVVLKALAKDPKDRFVTVQDFTAALELAVQEASDISSSFILQPLALPFMSDEHNTSPIGDNELVFSPSTSLLPASSSCPNPVPGPRVDWGGILTVPIFYGREEEQTLLAQWAVQERCRVISVLGMGGIGKSALVMSITHQLTVGTRQAQGTIPTTAVCPFEVVIFRSLHNAPSCEALLADCLQVFSPQAHEDGASPTPTRPTTLEQRINLLLEYMHKVRVLLVLDNLECLLEPGDVKGHFGPGFEGYEQLLRRVAETGHQGCLLLTSREKPASLRPLTSRYPSVRSLRLTGLDVAACKQILEEKKVVGTEPEKEQLIETYVGNPLALKMVTETIVDLFGGEIGPFLAEGTVLFSGISDLLDEQFARLSPLEQTVLCWLTIMREPVTLDDLQALLVIPQSRVQLLEAVDAGYRRCLIERGKLPGSFTLQTIVLEYVTQLLITEASREIQQRRLDKLIQYGLEQAGIGEYIRQMQERLLIAPLLTELRGAYPRRAYAARQAQDTGSGPRTRSTQSTGSAQGTIPTTPVEEQLLSLLGELRELPYEAQGYGPANLIALLRVQRGHLSGLDLPRLCLRRAYLQGIEMQDTSLAGALIRDCVFTEAASNRPYERLNIRGIRGLTEAQNASLLALGAIEEIGP